MNGVRSVGLVLLTGSHALSMGSSSGGCSYPASDSSYRVAYPPGPAGTAQTNIATGSYFVYVSGATPVGRSEAGQMVVRLPASLPPRCGRGRSS